MNESETMTERAYRIQLRVAEKLSAMDPKRLEEIERERKRTDAKVLARARRAMKRLAERRS